MSFWELPHTIVESYPGKEDQISPACDIYYFAAGVVIPGEGIYASPCIGDQEAFYTRQDCRDELDALFPPPPPEGEEPPAVMVEVRFGFMSSLEGVKCTLDGEVKYSDVSGVCSFFDVAQGEHTYSVEKEGMRVVSGQDGFGRPLGATGTTVIEWVPDPQIPYPEDQPWIMIFALEVGEAPPEDGEPQETSILGKMGSIVASASLVGIFVHSATKR